MCADTLDAFVILASKVTLIFVVFVLFSN